MVVKLSRLFLLVGIAIYIVLEVRVGFDFVFVLVGCYVLGYQTSISLSFLILLDLVLEFFSQIQISRADKYRSFDSLYIQYACC